MSVLRRATALKKALNFISSEVSLNSSSGFRSLRVLAGVSIPRPPPSRPHVFSRGYSSVPSRSRVHDPENWGYPPNEVMMQEGCDYEHWFIVIDPPEGNPTRDEIIDTYIKILARVVGSEEEARMKIYSVSTKHYFAFGCLVSEQVSKKFEEDPIVRWVLPDSYFDIRTKSYGGEPFINGQAVPYDPKYHEEWVRNNARCNERRSSDKNRNADRSRNFERRREMRQNANQRPPPNSSYGPQGNTMQGAPNSAFIAPQGSTQQGASDRAYRDPQGNTMQGAPNSAYIAPQRSSLREAPNRAYRDPQGNYMQGAPNSAYIAPQGNTTQGTPDSQGQSY